jgi:hypothetical protein
MSAADLLAGFRINKDSIVAADPMLRPEFVRI